jgi:hypothetical protein
MKATNPHNRISTLKSQRNTKQYTQIKSSNAETPQTDQSSFLIPHRYFIEHFVSEKKNTTRARQELEKL